MFFKADLVHENKVVALAVVLGGGGVVAPLAEAGHFLEEVEFLAAFGLDDPDHVAGVADDAHVILDVESDLEIVAPVSACAAVGRDDEKVSRKYGIGFVKFVKKTPRDE